MLLLRLYWEFFKTGLFAVGGGLATLPFLSNIADKTGWFTQEELANMIAVSESTPGPIGVNMATYVGFTTAGVPGAVISTLGLITPSIIVILLIARLLKHFQDNPYVNAVFRCLRPVSLGLIAASGGTVIYNTLFRSLPEASFLSRIDWKAVLLTAVLLLLTHGISKTKNYHPIVWIAFSAVVGMLFFSV